MVIREIIIVGRSSGSYLDWIWSRAVGKETSKASLLNCVACLSSFLSRFVVFFFSVEGVYLSVSDALSRVFFLF